MVFSINDCKENEKIFVIGGGNLVVEYVIVLCKIIFIIFNYCKKEFSCINEDNVKNL